MRYIKVLASVGTVAACYNSCIRIYFLNDSHMSITGEWTICPACNGAKLWSGSSLISVLSISEPVLCISCAQSRIIAIIVIYITDLPESASTKRITSTVRQPVTGKVERISTIPVWIALHTVTC